MATLVSVPTLVDLAFGPPETGTVNSTVLASLLQVIVHQVGLTYTRIEFRGSDAEKIQGLVGARGPVNNLQSESESFKPELLDDELGQEKELREPSGTSHGIESKMSMSSDKRQKVLDECLFVIDSGQIIQPQKSQAVSTSWMNRLEGKVKILQNQIEMLGAQSLPSNEALLEATRAQAESKPISDYWQSLNITKRMSGAEEGIDRLASLLETVAKEYAQLKIVIDQIQDDMGHDITEIMKQISLAANYAKMIRPREELYGGLLKKVDVSEVKTTTGAENQDIDLDEPAAEPDELDEELPEEKPPCATQLLTIRDSLIPDLFDNENITPENLNKLVIDQGVIKTNVEYLTAQINTLADFAETILPEILEGLPGMEELKRKINQIKDRASPSEPTLTGSELMALRDNAIPDRISELEEKVSKHASYLKRQEQAMCIKHTDLEAKIRSFEKYLETVVQQLRLDEEEAEENVKSKTEEFMEKVSVKLDGFQSEVKDIGYSVQELILDQKKKEDELKQMNHELDLLHQTKADKYEIEDILMEKADAHLLDLKISHDFFDTAWSDLSNNIEQIVSKTDKKDAALLREIEKIQTILDSKFNTKCAYAMKKTIEERLDELAESIRIIMATRDAQAAAATKKQLLTGVTCIACDNQSVMPTYNMYSSLPISDPMHPARNLQPLIAYELDYLRKMQAKNPDGKNLIQYEEMMKAQRPPHIASRYVGGSHTKLDPKSRVPKKGQMAREV